MQAIAISHHPPTAITLFPTGSNLTTQPTTQRQTQTSHRAHSLTRKLISKSSLKTIKLQERKHREQGTSHHYQLKTIRAHEHQSGACQCQQIVR